MHIYHVLIHLPLIPSESPLNNLPPSFLSFKVTQWVRTLCAWVCGHPWGPEQCTSGYPLTKDHSLSPLRQPSTASSFSGVLKPFPHVSWKFCCLFFIFFFKFFSNWWLTVYVCTNVNTCINTPQCKCEAHRKTCRVGSLLLLCGRQGLDSGCYLFVCLFETLRIEPRALSDCFYLVQVPTDTVSLWHVYSTL